MFDMYLCTAWHSFPNSWQIVYLFMNGYTNIAFGSLELEHLILFLFETSSKFFLSHDRSMSYLDSICIRAKSHSCKKTSVFLTTESVQFSKCLKDIFRLRNFNFRLAIRENIENKTGLSVTSGQGRLVKEANFAKV